MNLDPATQLSVANARHRARIHDATLRHLAASFPDRQWRRRLTGHP